MSVDDLQQPASPHSLHYGFVFTRAIRKGDQPQQVDAAAMSKYVLRSHDVLLSVTGEVGRLGIVRQSIRRHPDVLANKQIVVLRVRKERGLSAGRYKNRAIGLYAWLRSEAGQEVIRSIAKKKERGIRDIKKTDLEAMLIPAWDYLENTMSDDFWFIQALHSLKLDAEIAIEELISQERTTQTVKWLRGILTTQGLSMKQIAEG